jgi:hypothetical protein
VVIILIFRHCIRAWDKGFPGIVVQCPRTVAIRGAGAASSTDIPALDISHPHVIPIIREVLTQVASVFPSRYLHVGGDEVIPECWSESESMVGMHAFVFKILRHLLNNLRYSIFLS